MLLHKPRVIEPGQHGPPTQIPPDRPPIAQQTGARCRRNTSRNRPDRKPRGALRCPRQPVCTQEILEESHLDETLFPLPAQPISGWDVCLCPPPLWSATIKHRGYLSINAHVCVYCSFVQEHKHIAVTSREAREIDGGCHEGKCEGVIIIIVNYLLTNLIRNVTNLWIRKEKFNV